MVVACRCFFTILNKKNLGTAHTGENHVSRCQNQLFTPVAKNQVIGFVGVLSLYRVSFKSTLNNAKLQRNWIHQNYQNPLQGPGQEAKWPFLVFSAFL
jgi:hypothetical protein